MPTTAQFTLEQYEKMVDAGVFEGRQRQRLELIRGEIVQMSPIGYRHGGIVSWISRWSIETFPASQVAVHIQSTLRMPEQVSAPEPDIVWMRPDDYMKRHPEPDDVYLIIEVAESSVDDDMGPKADLYAEAGVADYWVVNLLDDCVEVFRNPTPTGYRTRTQHRDDDMIAPLAFPDVSVHAKSLTQGGD